MPTTWTAVNSKPNFNDGNTKLWSPFEGADGAVAYTDLIAGAYTFLGTAQLDTAQKSNGAASLLLDGNSDYITLPTSSDWNLAGGDFTLECRVRFNALTAGTYPVFIARCYDTTGSGGWGVYHAIPTGKLGFYYSTNGSNATDLLVSWTPVINTWYHIAIVRNGADLKFFVAGVQVGATQNIGADVIYNNSKPLSLGVDLNASDNPIACDYVNGWLDKVRISKGIARWTSNFTPQTMWVDV